MPRKAKPGASKPKKIKAAPKRRTPRIDQRHVRPPDRYKDHYGCLLHLNVELARLGLKVRDLPRPREQILMDLRDGVDAGALSKLYRWWCYNTEVLTKRSSHYEHALPRIELSVYFTRKGHFVLDWEPENLVLDRPAADCDFVSWPGSIRYDWSRPNNELMRIRELRDVELEFSRSTTPHKLNDVPDFLDQQAVLKSWEHKRGTYVRRYKGADCALLQATAELIQEVRHRLEYNFEVTMITDIFLEHEEAEDALEWDNSTHRLSQWTIENVRERTARLEDAKLDGFKKEFGFSLEEFVEAFAVADAHKLGKPHNLIERVSRALKKKGHKAMTPKVVTTYWAYIERHRPGLIPKKPEPPKMDGDPKVVPFKRYRGPREKPL